MCATAGPYASSLPRPAEGTAVDPIALEPVDSLTVTTLVDNVFDGLLQPGPGVQRRSFGPLTEPAPQFDTGATMGGLVAEHGFAALVTVTRGERSTTLLFDAGLTPNTLRGNGDRLETLWGDVQTVVLSHGHFDHAGGLAGLATVTKGLPMIVHPFVWTRRRLAAPDGEPIEFPTLTKKALEGEGFEVLERRVPSLLLEGCVLVTGEIDRVTEFERGMPPPHQALLDGQWHHDPTVIDDQALVVNVRDKGLVVLTGCGHAGVVNIARHAMRLTGVETLHALLGGFHLGGPAFEPVIGPTVTALTELAPALLGPGHCTGWRAQHTLAAAFPDAWVQPSVGTRYTFSAAPSAP